MLAIPLQPVPSQTLSASLGGQACDLKIYQKSTGLYLDLYVNGGLVIGGVSCLDRNTLVRSAYLGFIGDLAFLDTQGLSDPSYAGLGTQYQLIYLEPSDLAVAGLT